MTSVLIAVLVGIVTGLLQATFFEWIYHRNWLHRPWLPPQMFTAHTLVHHQLCKHEDTFHVHEEEQEEALSFQWWGGFALVGLNMVPWVGLGLGLTALGVNLPWVAFAIAVASTIFVYYLAYEGFHYLMHKPSIPWIESRGFFKFITQHHKLHHIHMGKNFNVVLPLADVLLGTLILTDPLPPQKTSPEAKRIARRHSRHNRNRTSAAPETGTEIELPAPKPSHTEAS
ncbi:MAG: hypothetical protein HOP12_12200 [Candidatus Eisenbacteria bacterium]|uniref:Fatty acid hydroxylase n=1 Tax=Eiseniibacteriota bacterium TaxID=2212470 RepID=A0A849SJZ3_UNCEI|nr:hypothetical protein [Candidatus Eisenbacteria bacterium]